MREIFGNSQVVIEATLDESGTTTEVVLRILWQRSRSVDPFVSSYNICIRTYFCPEWHDRSLFLRGTQSRHDNIHLRCTTEDWEQIKKSLLEWELFLRGSSLEEEFFSREMSGEES